MFGLRVSDKMLFIINIYFYISYSYCNSINGSFTPPQLRSGGWTPIPTSANNFKQSNGDKIASDSIQVSSKVRQPTEQQKIQDSEMLPIPVIKPHRHGATLGFDLPEQGLTLYLDINELATKPMMQNIGLKVVSHDSHQTQTAQASQAQQTQNIVKSTPNTPVRQSNASPNSNKLYNSNESPLSQFVNKMQAPNNSPKPVPKSPITVAKIQKRVKAVRNIGSYEGNGGSSGEVRTQSFGGSGGLNTFTNTRPKTQNQTKYRVGYMRPQDLHNALKHVGMTHSTGSFNNNNNNNNIPNTRTVVINTHSLNNNNNNIFNNAPNGQQIDTKPKGSALDSFKANPNKYFSTPITVLPQISLNKNLVPQTGVTNQQLNANAPAFNSAPQHSSYSYSSQQMPIRPSIQYPVQEQEKEPDVQIPQQEEEPPVQQTSQEEEQDFKDNEVVVTRTTTAPPLMPPQEEDVQQKGFDDDIEGTTQSYEDNRFEEPQRQVMNGGTDREEPINNIKQTISVVQPVLSTNTHFTPEDDSIIKPFPSGRRPQPDTTDSSLHTCPTQCQQTCEAKTDNLITDASNIREIIEKLKADSLINAFPNLETELQTVVDFASTNGYTIILPSNEAISRLPPNLFEFWKNNVNSLAPLLDNHVIESAQSLEEMRLAEIIQPRSASKLRVQRAHNESYTINGERVSVGNQVGPNGGTIHVIDGILYPNADKDIMETLKSCNRLDGFVTLAEGTGFADTLKGSGPFTVFVPSNEALQKVPDNDLDIIRNNMTALREFLKYHVAQGSYYSNDLKDGQYIPSLINDQYIQVGVRVDGCRRRLVEANVSPLYRADIPASNGVIHVVDWILKPTDRDWCENVILPR